MRNDPTTPRKVRTLIVDDSNFVRTMLSSGLSQDNRIEVVGLAADGVEALSKIKALKPDVVTLDIEMPRLNGIGVLERVVGKMPISFVVVSTLTKAGATITFEALQKGAFDYVTKPKVGGLSDLPAFKRKLVEASPSFTTPGPGPSPRTSRPAWSTECPRSQSPPAAWTGFCPCRKFPKGSSRSCREACGRRRWRQGRVLWPA